MAVATTNSTGVSFALTDDQQDFKDAAHAFAKDVIRPVAAEADQQSKLPMSVLEQGYEQGLMNLHIPEEYGGLGLGAFEGVLVMEELAWGCSGIATSMEATGLGSAPVVIAGNESQKQQYLGGLINDQKYCCFALTEPGAGSDVAGIQTTATLSDDGTHYTLNGNKTFITNAEISDWMTIFAMTDKAAGHRGLSAFIVEVKKPDGTPVDGFTCEGHMDKLGQRASPTNAIFFDDVKLPVENRLGEEGEGFKIAMKTLDSTRPGVGAMATGVARSALEYAMAYAVERVQFGMPIAMNQGVNFLIADMATNVEAARLLTWQGAWLHDQGKRATLQSSHAKRFAADICMAATTDAVQIFGGYGYTKEYPVEKLMRDAKIFQIYEGTSQIQRLVIAKELMMPRS